MPRILYLAGLFAVAPVALAGDPVPAYPTGSLSQPLTSIVSGAQYAAPAPVMVSQPAWGAACPPTYGPTCPTPQPLLAPRQYRMPYPVAQPCDTGYGYRGGLLDRLRAWLCGGSSPALPPSRVWATPIRPWVPGHGRIVGEDGGACGYPSACDGAACPRFPMGNAFGANAACPTPVPVGPRPIRIPLPSATDCAPGAGECRPGLLRRVLSMFTGGWFSRSAMPNTYMAPPSGYYTAPAVEPGCAPAANGYHYATPTAQPVPVQSYQGYPLSAAPVPTPTVAAPVVSPAPPAPTISPAAAASQPFTRQR